MTQATIKAIVTGHSRGLGAALAEDLLNRGIAVLGMARAGNPTLAGRADGLFSQTTLDLADTTALTAWIDGGGLTAAVADAQIALLINNAGVVAPIGPPGHQGAAAIARAVAINVTGPLVLADAFTAATATATTTTDRRILHLSSGAARTAFAGWSIYGATKAALDHHARCIQQDGVAGLRVVSLAPGVVDTDMQAEVRATGIEQFPLLPRFEALKADGNLTTPAAAARRIIDHLLSDGFGHNPAPDVRTLP